MGAEESGYWPSGNVRKRTEQWTEDIENLSRPLHKRPRRALQYHDPSAPLNFIQSPTLMQSHRLKPSYCTPIKTVFRLSPHTIFSFISQEVVHSPTTSIFVLYSTFVQIYHEYICALHVHN